MLNILLYNKVQVLYCFKNLVTRIVYVHGYVNKNICTSLCSFFLNSFLLSVFCEVLLSRKPFACARVPLARLSHRPSRSLSGYRYRFLPILTLFLQGFLDVPQRHSIVHSTLFPLQGHPRLPLAFLLILHELLQSQRLVYMCIE